MSADRRDDATKSIAEISITGCTIQHAANYSGSEDKTVAPGGANIRLAGKEVYPIDSVTISGNVISDTTTNIDINDALDVVISANTFFAPKPNNLMVANSQRVIVNGNTFNPRQFSRPGTIHFRNSQDCIVTNSTLHQFTSENARDQTGRLFRVHDQRLESVGLHVRNCVEAHVAYHDLKLPRRSHRRHRSRR